ncbi:WYL domain-containing protein [Rhodovulum sulfidophilum]|uniref:WYL domain-containing protein n=1 Tax=Rhodovulum sulfidophilum TaxID=35806 RepID=UPI00351BB7D4
MSERRTEREIWPLGLSYGPNALMLLCFCQLRQAYRLFHMARIGEVRPDDTSLRPRRVDLLRGYLARRSSERG